MAQASYKMDLVCKSMRRVDQRTSAEYILKRLEAIYLRWKHKSAKNTNVNAVDGKPTVKDGKSTLWKRY